MIWNQSGIQLHQVRRQLKKVEKVKDQVSISLLNPYCVLGTVLYVQGACLHGPRLGPLCPWYCVEEEWTIIAEGVGQEEERRATWKKRPNQKGKQGARSGKNKKNMPRSELQSLEKDFLVSIGREGRSKDSICAVIHLKGWEKGEWL